ncbi:MAG: M14 family metallopeptidase [Chitinophagaceae bacterium]
MFSLFKFSTAQPVKSPDEFLGYQLGASFTEHYKVVNYLQYLSEKLPTVMKLENYGTTNEGKPLMIAIVSSAENINNLKQIKNNNLNLAGFNNGAEGHVDMPTVVWMSYNVHGNEASSTEVAMKLLYEMASGKNEQLNEWLKHAVVIVDPCLNPDGRDRYVHWYNQTKGSISNENPYAREHSEPWPGGRTNHYNFDLNRDWAWQTQIESKQRVKKYLEWMPQVHVDFHEQGYNEPYYFAPAAEPFHEVITPWQRNFQTQIGKNHSKYFDANGWLYFTKQIFDLFYPSYGDTYPTYNGSVGMTYEQGGIRAGLSVKTNAGEVLTLADRALHHFTTSMSTIETASKNAKQLVDEFSKYFSEIIQSKNSTYKTYILTSDDENKLKAVTNLLDANGIIYGQTNNKGIGYNYATGKEESIVAKKYSIAVSVNQSRSAFVTVLLEPKGKLSDSATYDITAWSLPYVYGVDGYALKERKEIAEQNDSAQLQRIVFLDYGALIPFNSLNSAKYLAYLLKNNVKVRYATKSFTIDDKNYLPGTLIVLSNGNATVDWKKIVNDGARKFNIHPVAVHSGFVDKGSDFGSPDVRLISAPKVALLSGEQTSVTDAGESWCFFDNELDYPLSLINAADIGRLDLKKYDVIIMPEGNYKSLNDKANAEKLKDFVKAGGRLVAIQGAVNLLAQNGDFGIKNKAEKEDDKADSGYAALKKYGNRERDDLPNNIPGAIYKVELDNTHPLAYGYGNTYYTLKQDANIYEFMKDGWNVGVLKNDNYVTGFTGFKVKNKLKDGTLFGVYEMGNGSVVFLADNPLFRLFWENGKQLFCNAVFMVGQ